MQALQDHFGGEEEEEEGGGDGGGEEEQIWHWDFCEGGLRKVHLMQDQEDIDIIGDERGVWWRRKVPIW